MLSGLTHSEMIKSCKADHKDPARTHVWGYPYYVLDPALHNNKQIPKWNWRARIGQLLGFSRFRSSTMALVQNLNTGHITPQYYVMFDDKFETVFNEGRTTEEID